MTQTPTALEARVNRAWTILRKNPTLLMGYRHPNPDCARRGQSFRSFVVFLLRSAGASGKTRACKYVEGALLNKTQPRLELYRIQEGEKAL